MLTLHGKLLNVIRREPREGAENKFDPYGQAQFQTEEVLDDGQVKIALHTLSISVDLIDGFKKMMGKDVEIPVRAWARNNGISFGVQAGVLPRVSHQSPASN